MTLRLRMEDVKNFKLIVKNYGQKQEQPNLLRHSGVVLPHPTFNTCQRLILSDKVYQVKNRVKEFNHFYNLESFKRLQADFLKL